MVTNLASYTDMLQTWQEIAVSTSQAVSTHEDCSVLSQVTLDLLQYSHQGRRISANLQVLAEFLT